jgi:hypothetical protein
MPTSTTKRPWLLVLRWILILLFLLIIALVGLGFYVFRDRTPGYSLDLRIDDAKARANARPLRVGFGRVKINPELWDTNRPVWLAGFSQKRAATSIHDDLWAVACVVDDGSTRVGIVALDAIGFFHDDVVAVRRRCDPQWKLDYTVICSTHDHSAPDLLGLWGPNYLRTGVTAGYRRQVIAGATLALGEAVGAMQPARVAFHELSIPTDGLVADTRRPIVFDPDIRLMHFTSTNGATIGTIVGWANHPETVWALNTQITADYCGYLRDTLEKGFASEGRTLAQGVGGVHLYVNGAVGGLMSTTPRVTVRDPYLEQDFEKPSHEKARAVAHRLAARILPALQAGNVQASDSIPISVRARTIAMPLANKEYLAASYLGLIDRGYVRWKTLRTEVALLTMGDASIVCVPGEIYPEIVNGGIEKPPGADFDIEPVEVPPLRDLMPGKIKFVFGLANDEVGYLVPKSEWDQKPPYLYGSKTPPYGEINSCGPDSARLIHGALAEFCRERKAFAK